MAKINQVGVGRKSKGAIDGITYVTRKGKTYARSNPLMPASVYKTPAALRRQAIFRMVQMHMKFHYRTIRQTFTPRGTGSAANRYYSENGKAFTMALGELAERWVAGEIITLNDVETAISTFAASNPQAVKIALRDGYGDVFLTGEWPSTITLRASGSDSTIIIIVAENGATTTINPDGTTVVVDSGSNSGSGSGSGSGSSTGSETSTVAAPVISGTTPFTESTSATIRCSTDGASIYYTVDGSTPTSASTAYTEAIAMTDTTTVKAIAVKDGVSSSVSSKTFTKGTGNDDSE